MKISRKYFIQSSAVPIKVFQSGLNSGILKSFCARHKLETKIEDMSIQRLSLAGPHEKFAYDFYKNSLPKSKEYDSRMEYCAALQWIKTCKLMDEGQNHASIKSIAIPKYFILDLETTTKSANNRTANCFVRENFVVLPGWLDYKGYVMIPSRYALAEDYQFDQQLISKNNPTQTKGSKLLHRVLPPLDNYELIVGHNLKFDLTYLWGDPELKKFLRRGGQIWDTMYVEYLIEGHLATIPQLLDEENRPVEELLRKGRKSGILTLDAIAPKYGGSKKIDLVKRAWEANLETSDIPFEILAEYLAFDLKNTELVFKEQFNRVNDRRMTKLIENRMDFILSACEIESNGIMIDPAVNSETLEDPQTKPLQSFISSENLFRPDIALILTSSSEELTSFKKFLNNESIVNLFFDKTKKDGLATKNLSAISRFTKSEPHPSHGNILSFTWPDLRQKCLLLLLAIFDGVQEFSSPTCEMGERKLQERFDAFRNMCKFFITKNEEICLQKKYTKLKLSQDGKEVRHFLKRVMLCLPTMNYIAFEENPYFKNRRYSTKHMSTFDLKSIENDVLRYFVSSVAQICHGRIYRHFSSCPLQVQDNAATAEWTRPDLCIEPENLEKQWFQNRYDDNARLILCTTDSLWIDVLSTDSEGDTKSHVISDVTKIMQGAFAHFCELFDDFKPIFGNSACLKEFITDPLQVEVKTLT
ncbi:mitochondrial DNA polymerase I protein D [Perkinsela sp. CCAP 1560/4]|nr:mitochondrial DNA polymerase I protein D [Perkinsela sp. CCAP 1560/4]KNH09093.1 mitochondrial DNA polymerase I protein D [Perkinsela sp. CCAP 1560/4]|eukprot:KNH05324.1 mitochondrial DNA polymerase I protein D [Perkinsela sp. CCAP 1560/4]